MSKKMANNLLASCKYCITIVLLFLLGYTSKAQDFGNYYKGLASFESGDYKGAIGFFSSSMNDDLNLGEILKYRAECYYNLGDYNSSKIDFSKLKTYNISDGSYGMARCYAAEGDAVNAMEELKIHLSQNHKNPRGFIKLDKTFENIRKTSYWEDLWYDEWYSKYDQLYEDANYYYLESDYERAFEFIEDLLERKPRNHKAYALRAMVYEKTGDLKMAKDDFSEAITLKKKNATYYEGRARIYSLMEKNKLALEDITKAIELDRYNPAYITIQAQLLFDTEQISKATAKLNNYLSLFEKDDEALYLYGKCYFSNENYSNAIDEFTKAILANPSQPKFYLARGNSYLMIDDLENSENDFSMALDLDPKLAQVYMSRGIVRLNKNENEAACRDFRKAYKYGYLKAVEMIQLHCE